MKKLCSVILALTLLLALLPAAVLADTVFTVNVDAAVPLAGQTPWDAAPTVSSSTTRVYAYEWRYQGERMSNSYDKFEKGKTYTLTAAITSTGSFNENTKVYVNGSFVYHETVDEHIIRISTDFTVTGEQLNDLTVTLPQALPGSKISKVAEEGVVEGTEGAIIQAIFWHLNGEEVPPKEGFKAGATYEAGIRLYAREGYRFAVPLRVTCNGQTFDDISGDGETAYFKIQYSTDTKGQTAGAIRVEVNEPKAGEKPSEYAGHSGGGGFGVINNSDTVPWDYYQRGVEWYDLTAQAPQSYNDPFQEGHAYRVTIHYILYDGYEWPDSSLHSINDKAPTGIDQQGDKLTLSYDFPPLATTQAAKETGKNPFEDVKETDDFYDAVLWAYYAEPQVTNGIDATHFGPASTVTRGQAVTFLWRAMGCPEPANKTNPFVDVPESEYYYKAILWALEKGITIGTDDTHFTPDQTCSTAHILTFLYRTLGIGDNGWYEEAGAWAKDAGLLDGLTLAVSPEVDCPRADVVLFLYRQLGK